MPAADPLLAAQVAAFGVATVACVASLTRVSRLEHADTRRGFAALLATSAGWSAAQLGFLLAPGADLKVAFHVLGLVVGFAAVGAWLYFCSSYSGRTLHRDPRYRRAALAVFLVVVAVKVTNPLHHAYFSATVVSEPFPHVVVQPHALHWVATGLAYAVATVGYFMLFELFDRTSLDARPLAALAALTALPVAGNVVAYSSPNVVDMSYEPIGVAAFSVGVLYVFVERFQAVRVAGDVDDPVVFLDEDGRVKDFNVRARELFPGLEGATGDPLENALPAVATSLQTGDDEDLLALDVNGEPRYFLVTPNPFTSGHTRLGQLLLFSDVTENERHRRELERQNERLGQFASIVSHDLRNPLNVAQGHVELAREERDSDHLETVANAHERMEALIEDVLALARQGETIGETEPCKLGDVARDAWGNVDTAGASLHVEADRTVDADRTRLVQFLENLFRNAVEHASTGPRSQVPEDGEHGSTSPRSNTHEDVVKHAGPDVTVTIGATDEGFFVADDGPGIPDAERETVFEPGYTTSEGGTGFGLAIVNGIADAHDWTVRVTDSDTGGARFDVTGVTTPEQQTEND